MWRAVLVLFTQQGGDRGNEVGEEAQSNKAMKLTRLSAALWYGRQDGTSGRCRLVPALAGLDAGTASQLIAGVRQTKGGA